MISFKFKKFISNLKTVSLSESERESLRANFLARAGISETGKVSLFRRPMFRYASIVAYSVLLFVVGIVPLAIAADRTEPGDLLYPLKVAVNEPVKNAVRKVIPFQAANIEPAPDAVESDEEMPETPEKEDEREIPLERKPAPKQEVRTKENITIPIPSVSVPVITDIPNDIPKTVASTTEKIEKSVKDTVQEIDKGTKEILKETEDTIKNDIEKPIEKVLEKPAEIIKKVDLPF